MEDSQDWGHAYLLPSVPPDGRRVHCPWNGRSFVELYNEEAPEPPVVARAVRLTPPAPVKSAAFLPGIIEGLFSDEHHAILGYLLASYLPLNAFLRGGRPDASARISENIFVLDCAFSRAAFPAQSTPLYRGEVDKDHADLLVETLEAGDTLLMCSFWSTSRLETVARSWAPEGLIWQIERPMRHKAIDVKETSPFPNENEVLWNRGTCFRVLSVDAAARIITIEVEE